MPCVINISSTHHTPLSLRDLPWCWINSKVRNRTERESWNYQHLESENLYQHARTTRNSMVSMQFHLLKSPSCIPIHYLWTWGPFVLRLGELTQCILLKAAQLNYKTKDVVKLSIVNLALVRFFLSLVDYALLLAAHLWINNYTLLIIFWESCRWFLCSTTRSLSVVDAKLQIHI